MTGPSASWQAQLDLRFRAVRDRTVLAERRHLGPLVVQRPFYPEGGVCHVYLVHPPGGIVGGDALELQVQAEPGSHALITTPAATRFYRAGPHPHASLRQTLRVQDATLEWLPQETIVFDGARARSRTQVHLQGRSRFLGWEILCLGRPANAERFTHGDLHQDFELHHDGVPVMLDRLRLQGAAAPLDAGWGLQGAQAQGTLLAYPVPALDLEVLRATPSPQARFALTLVDGALLCRALSAEAEPIRNLFTALWLRLRPAVIGCQPVSPRIWAT